MTTGFDLKEARERAGLTQEAVAQQLRMSRITIVNWEQRAEVKPEKAARYFQAVIQLAKAA